MDDFYEYSPLETATSIRLLVLQPPSRRNEDYLWQGEIDEVSFEALSYTWGDESSVTRVSQHGKPKWVRASKSLDSILESLRYADVERRLWVDALSINQRDIEERNRIVPRMREIYSHATEVVICLGDERFFSEFIPQTLLAIHDSIAAYDHRNGFAKLDERLEAIMKSQPSPYSFHGEVTYRWENLRSWLYDRKWFRRVWVLQEAAVAHKSIVKCGNWQMGGTSFFQTLGIFSRFPLPRSIADVVDGFDAGITTALQQIGLMRELGAGNDAMKTMSLMDLLKRSRGVRATDPHDHIYGLMGLVSETDLPKIDYNEPWQQTYRRFVIYLLEAGHLADILQNCFLDDTLLTWIPNWASKQDAYGERAFLSIPYHTPGVNTAGYRAGGMKPPTFAIEGDILNVRGVLAMTIKTMGKGRGRPRFDQPPEATAKVVLETLDEIYSLGSAPDKKTLDLLAWMTLTCGQNWDENRPFQSKDFHVCYPYVAPNYKLLDMDDELQPIKDSKRGRQLISRLAFEEYKPWNQKVMVPPPFDEMRRFERKVLDFAVTNRRCVTDAKLVGQVPRRAEVGDIVALLEGVAVPIVLRQEKKTYKIVGPAYFSSLMDGQAVTTLAKKMDMIPLK